MTEPDATPALDAIAAAIGGGAFGVNLHLAPGDLVAAPHAELVDVTPPESDVPAPRS